jgi:hypothetical protein
MVSGQVIGFAFLQHRPAGIVLGQRGQGTLHPNKLGTGFLPMLIEPIGIDQPRCIIFGGFTDGSDKVGIFFNHKPVRLTRFRLRKILILSWDSFKIVEHRQKRGQNLF